MTGIAYLSFIARGRTTLASPAYKQAHLCDPHSPQVENKAALHAFEGIAEAADGLVMSRGNLGLSVAPEKLATVQKALISHCNVLGKPILLTRFVDTMAGTPRPTRSDPAGLGLLG